MANNILKIIVLLSFLGFTLGQESSGKGVLANDYPDRIKLCKDLTGDTTITFHVFNLTNPGDFQNPNEFHKAEFQEVGPYSYREIRTKGNCMVGADDFSIIFDESRKVEPVSNKDLFQNTQDIINTANIPFQRYGQEVYLDDSYSAMMSIWNLVSSGENYIRENVSISSLLMDGVNVTIYNRYVNDPLTIGRDRLPELEKPSFAIWPELKVVKKLKVNSDKESWGKIMEIEDTPDLPWWTKPGANPICSQISGSDGGHFYGVISQTSPLHFYSEELCSTVPLIFHKAITVEEIPALLYLFPEDLLDSTTCFCQDEDKTKCLPKGAIDGKYCRESMPYIISNPHFLFADPSYTVNVTGMKPNAYEHQSYFIIEPTTGTVLESSRKFQLNVNVSKLPEEVMYLEEVSVPNTIFPVFWVDKVYKLDAKSLAELRESLKETATTTTTVKVNPTTEKTGDDDDGKYGTWRNKASQSNGFHVLTFSLFILSIFIFY